MFKCLNGALSVDVGALTQLYCAVSPRALQTTLDSRFFVPVAVESPVFNNCPDITKEMKERLWSVTEELIGEKFEV